MPAAAVGSASRAMLMSLRNGYYAVLVSLTALASSALHAAPSGDAFALTTPPELDGDVLNDAAWRDVRPLTDFTQVRPLEGAPASQRTEAFVGYTADALYIAVVCYDDDPSAIIVADGRRDAELDDTDSIRVVIDSFLSRQNGFVFGTNPAGAEYDGQVTNESSSRLRSGGGFNLEWDTSWVVRSTVGAFGWSTEMKIPFTSLRYGSGDVQSWGMNFQRNIRRNNEVAYWAPLPRQFALNRLSLAGAVNGIAVPPQRNFKFIPYALARAERGGQQDGTRQTSELGFDVKYSVTPSLTLDATYNTDFAQVEVDQQQVNLDRFSLFFPEKRPFFLENAGQFAVGQPGDVELFFSRRIGIAANGTQLPIAGGARLSGKVGASTNVGLLHMRSEEVAGVAPETDFSVARVNQELANRSSVGLLWVNRDAGDRDNQTYAVDGRWGIGGNTLLEGFAARTSTPGITEDDYAWRLAGGYDSELWAFNGSYSEVGAGFNPEVGFLTRKDYRRVGLFAQRRYRPEALWGLLELRPHASYNGYWSFDGHYDTGFLHIDNSMEWKGGEQLHTAINFTHEGVRTPFAIARDVTVPVGEYDHSELSVFAGTDRSAPFSVNMGLTAGGFFGGDRFAMSPSLRYRVGEKFDAALTWDHNDIDLPVGKFEVDLTGLRLTYSFTPKVLVQSLVQHNSRDDTLSTNLRFSWLQSANAGLYIVYNETDNRGFGGRTRRELILKYSRILNAF